jgi:tellurite resistance protein TehA-like permease
MTTMTAPTDLPTDVPSAPAGVPAAMIAAEPAGAVAAEPARQRAGIGPNWFASVMGTGIVANAAATLPLQFPGLRTVATLVWLAATVLLVGVIVAWVWHGRVHADNPVMAPFWGAPPMALMTVGGGTLLLGRDWIGLSAAVHIDLVLWTLGTIMGLVTAVAIPYLMITRHRIKADGAFGGWLMPVVPPMVSAANGALLIPHLAGGRLRLDMLVACYAMFGISLFATIIIVPQLWGRLVHHGVGEARMVPTLWIVLGPLGQAITAAHLLGVAAPSALPARTPPMPPCSPWYSGFRRGDSRCCGWPWWRRSRSGRRVPACRSR